MNLIKSISYKVRKQRVKLRKNREDSSKLDESERMALNIFKSLKLRPESTCHIAPVSGERIVENQEMQMMAILSSQRITIINSSYQYEIMCSIQMVELMRDKFDRRCERKAALAKNRWSRKVNRSLDNILDNLRSLESRHHL